MITIKAFNENLCCRGFQYKIGEEYEIPTNEVKMCKRGFHASAHCDISETVLYYSDVLKTRYCLVDINVVEENDDKVVGDRIKILKELDLDGCIKYDKTGKWCYEYIYNNVISNKNVDVKKFQNVIIQKDQTGIWCYYFAKNIKGADIERLQEAVIQKDRMGDWCYWFALDIKGADIEKLGNAVIEKNKNGYLCYIFAKDVEGANIEKFKNIIIEKDKSGEYCYKFVKNVKNTNLNDILQKIRKKFGRNNKYYQKILNLIKK